MVMIQFSASVSVQTKHNRITFSWTSYKSCLHNSVADSSTTNTIGVQKQYNVLKNFPFKHFVA